MFWHEDFWTKSTACLPSGFNMAALSRSTVPWQNSMRNRTYMYTNDGAGVAHASVDEAARMITRGPFWAIRLGQDTYQPRTTGLRICILFKHHTWKAARGTQRSVRTFFLTWCAAASPLSSPAVHVSHHSPPGSGGQLVLGHNAPGQAHDFVQCHDSEQTNKRQRKNKTQNLLNRLTSAPFPKKCYVDSAQNNGLELVLHIISKGKNFKKTRWKCQNSQDQFCAITPVKKWHSLYDNWRYRTTGPWEKKCKWCAMDMWLCHQKSHCKQLLTKCSGDRQRKTKQRWARCVGEQRTSVRERMYINVSKSS